MIDTTILLSLCYAPCCLCQLIVVEGGFLPSRPLRPPLFQANHEKPLAASGLASFGLTASGFASFRSVGFQFGMMIASFGFGDGRFHGFAAAGCAASAFAVAGLVAAGSEVFGLAAEDLAVVRFKQHWVHRTDAAETTSVTKTAE